MGKVTDVDHKMDRYTAYLRRLIYRNALWYFQLVIKLRLYTIILPTYYAKKRFSAAYNFVQNSVSKLSWISKRIPQAFCQNGNCTWEFIV